MLNRVHTLKEFASSFKFLKTPKGLQFFRLVTNTEAEIFPLRCLLASFTAFSSVNYIQF
jgi:hypothetical protein